MTSSSAAHISRIRHWLARPRRSTSILKTSPYWLEAHRVVDFSFALPLPLGTRAKSEIGVCGWLDSPDVELRMTKIPEEEK